MAHTFFLRKMIQNNFFFYCWLVFSTTKFVKLSSLKSGLVKFCIKVQELFFDVLNFWDIKKLE